jgi:23S rRNA (cytosine1962-C5)-methyltransferase
MSQDSVTARVRLRPGREARTAGGHLWVYESAIGEVSGHPDQGDIVDVVTERGRFLGRGYINPASKIRVRILTHQVEPIDDAFFERRLRSALALRARVVSGTTAYRMVFGEGDLLPGLIVDRYADLLVMQALTAGIDRRQERLADMLLALTGAKAIYLRNDARSRTLEGLALSQGFLRGTSAPGVEIAEHSTLFSVDVARGQKTGWFCDQRENRLAVAALAPATTVLDAFCHTGGFGVHAARSGATAVLGLDSSAEAIGAARGNAALNGVEGRCEYRAADAFEELRRLDASGYRCDLAVLDPPAFARTREAVPRAMAGYKEINLSAIKLLRPEGVLVSCSCSWHVDEGMFWTAVLDAARDAGRDLRLLEFRSQARDHPMLAAMPETRYLKCLILQAF